MRSLLLAVLAGAAGVLAACGPSSTPGPDRSSGSDATLITWSDGKPAYSITCMNPGGCQERALALCRPAGFTTLSSENMPTVGAVRTVHGRPSAVIRCG